MNEYEPIKQEESLVPADKYNGEDETTRGDYMNEFRGQAQEYSQRLNEAAMKAKDYASEKFAVANERFKELQNKEPQELVEDAKDYARKNPGQTILISAAAGLILGFLLRRR
jgi:ElaB/YqjD/DUF883 family membrane-anchored ribosome-binding protein